MAKFATLLEPFGAIWVRHTVAANGGDGCVRARVRAKLGPKPDLDEAVMDELDYLHTYARQNGEAAAWRNAADTIVKLRRYTEEQKARLAEAEMRVRGLEQQIRDLERDVAVVLRRRGYIVQQPGEEVIADAGTEA